jgi:hypothetical protein
MYNGTYIFFTTDYITFLGSELFIVSSETTKVTVGPDSIKYYSGVIQVKVLGNFNQISIYTEDGYCGENILIYGSEFNQFVPHSYSFVNG